MNLPNRKSFKPLLNFTRYCMVFDVESIGLHGEGFAVSWLVLDMHAGGVVEEKTYACNPELASGSEADRQWVEANVPTLFSNCKTPAEVRSNFWTAWLFWRTQSARLAADSTWPVETNFLSACVHDVGTEAYFTGPYPLIDIDAIATATGLLGKDELIRNENELPAHDPSADTRFSARRLITMLSKLES